MKHNKIRKFSSKTSFTGKFKIIISNFKKKRVVVYNLFLEYHVEDDGDYGSLGDYNMDHYTINLAIDYLKYSIKNDCKTMELNENYLKGMVEMLFVNGFLAKMNHLDYDILNLINVLKISDDIFKYVGMRRKYRTILFDGICFNVYLSYVDIPIDINNCRVLLCKSILSLNNHDGYKSIIDISSSVHIINDLIEEILKSNIQLIISEALISPDIAMLLSRHNIYCLGKINIKILNKLSYALKCPIINSVDQEVEYYKFIGIVNNFKLIHSASKSIAMLKMPIHYKGFTVLLSSWKINAQTLISIKNIIKMTLIRIQGIVEEWKFVHDLNGDIISTLKINHTITTSLHHPPEVTTSVPLGMEASPPEVSPAVSSPLEVQSNSVPTRRGASFNYLSLKSNATPGDRGDVGGVDGGRVSTRPQVESETIHGSRGEVNREAVCKTTSGGTASGMKSSTRPQVEPVADLREAKGEVNRRGTTPSGRPQVESRLQDNEWTSGGNGENSVLTSGNLLLSSLLTFSDYLDMCLYGNLNFPPSVYRPVMNCDELRDYFRLDCFRYYNKMDESCSQPTYENISMSNYKSGYYLSDFIFFYNECIKSKKCPTDGCNDDFIIHQLHYETYNSKTINKRITITVNKIDPTNINGGIYITFCGGEIYEIKNMTFGKFIYLLLNNKSYIGKCGHLLFNGHQFNIILNNYRLSFTVHDISTYNIEPNFDKYLYNCFINTIPIYKTYQIQYKKNKNNYIHLPYHTIKQLYTQTYAMTDTISIPWINLDSLPLEVQSNSFHPAVSSSNYLPVNGNATPRDRGGSGDSGVMDNCGDKKHYNPTISYNKHHKTNLPYNIPHNSPPEVTTTVGPADSSPPEVITSVPLGVEPSSNYLSLKSNATPGDRGDGRGVDGGRVSTRPQVESETIHGSRGEVNREAVCKTTSGGKESSTGPRVEPAADLREAKGQLNKESCLQDNERISIDTSTTQQSTSSLLLTDESLDILCYESYGIDLHYFIGIDDYLIDSYRFILNRISLIMESRIDDLLNGNCIEYYIPCGCEIYKNDMYINYINNKWLMYIDYNNINEFINDYNDTSIFGIGLNKNLKN